jgi:alpha-tubulin suppressor-like RCC1 family protein
MLRRVALAALALSGAAGIAPTGATAEVGPLAAPVVSRFLAVPGVVPSGGTTTVIVAVSGASTCKLSSNKPVAGLPATFSCESGSVERSLTMPANKGLKDVEYRLSLKVKGPGGATGAKTIATVGNVPASFSGAQQIEGGSRQACALVAGGRVDCWGANTDGVLGYPPEGREGGCEEKIPCAKLPVQVKGVADAVQVSTGFSDTCAVLSNGHVDCWGEELALGGHKTKGASPPVEVLGISEATQVGIGGLTACALLSSGHVYCCALLSSGHIDCWGDGHWGQLGNGETFGSQVPVEVLGVTSARGVAATWNSTCALLSDGHVECWGRDDAGELGDDGSKNADIPGEVLEG